MDDKLSNASQKVLAEIVKLAQKQGRQGSKGGWKDFLNAHDRKLGSCLSDPAKRPRETLLSFLHTFTRKEDFKFLERVLRLHSIRELLGNFVNEFPGNGSPEQRLVHSTLKHPLYISKFVFPSYNEDWVVTKISNKIKLMSSSDMLAVDCEMVLCEDGTDALVRVCVVDRNLQVKLDELVNPCKQVADYRTEITGITAQDLDAVTCSLAVVQKSLKKLLSKRTILVGHGLHNDMLALKLDHVRVIDTSFIFKTADGNLPSLNTLCKSVLGYELHKEGVPHNCLDDARATMKLVLAKIEQSVDNDIPLIQEEGKKVPKVEMEKLLIHRIPLKVPIEELRSLFPSNFKIELKLLKKTQAQYSAFAIFENSLEAHQAFTNVNGKLEQDTSGLPQKLITFQQKAGPIAGLYIRKMGHDEPVCQVPEQKRSSQSEEVSFEIKKCRTEQLDVPLKEIERLKMALKQKDLMRCSDHLLDIERLKQELNAKNFQISTQDKIIADLQKKLEEKKKKRKRSS